MQAVYRLVGYDKKTERLEIRVDIPQVKVNEALAVASIKLNQDIEVGDWELTPEQAKYIGDIIGFKPNLRNYDYFLEPYVFEGPIAEYCAPA